MGVVRQLPASGVWGPVTATLDWCELNYEHTRYIAEYWNTLSNMAMLLPPLYSMLVAWRVNIERRFIFLYSFLMLVGFGSWLFHMTLRYEMQLMDELPMEWGTLIMVYCLLTVHKPNLDGNRMVKLGLLAYGIVLAVVYLHFKTPIIHQAGYGILTTYALYLDIMIVRKLKVDNNLLYTALALYYTGFLVWNIDNMLCAQLEELRQSLPFVLRPFTQCHAWWHVLAGYGSYVHVAFCIQTRSVSLGKPITYRWSGIILTPSLDKQHSK